MKKTKEIYKGGKTLLDRFVIFLVKLLLRLRYRIVVKGVRKILDRGTQKILFLPNHVGLVDPLIIFSTLHKDFVPRTIADANNVGYFLIDYLAKRVGARTIPDMTISGPEAKEELKQVISETIEGMKQGENLLMYPAGRLKRQWEEKIGATSATEEIVKAVPGLRVVLMRQNGLWGSSFSWGLGKKPNLFKALIEGVKCLFLNLLFFMPKRVIEIEFVEPEDFPVDKDKITINTYLEKFYNENNAPNTYVPYLFWEKGKTRVVPEPPALVIEGNIASVPEATKKIVAQYLEELTGHKGLTPDHRLAYDLGLDSVSIAEIAVWLEKEFGFPQGNTDSYQTVGDIMIAATGKGLLTGPIDFKSIGKKWFAFSHNQNPISIPQGETIPEVFLNAAKRYPDRTIIADQQSGERTYRQMITAILVLKPFIQSLQGDKIGLMFPAGVGGDIFYLAVLFAGKTPVMINWTTGMKNIVFSLQNVGVQSIITAKKLLIKLKGQGIDFQPVEDKIFYIEDLGKKISFFSKIKAKIQSFLSWGSLQKGPFSETAVVLFTSGSESTPKSVPLSHKNILTNIRDVIKWVQLYESEVILGILPPFHSFGLVATSIFPLCSGIRAVYHANPTEAVAITKNIEAYQVTMLVSTPTFMQGIFRVSRPEQLKSMRIIITGAEKCPESTYHKAQELCPGIKILEGYGLTECSPVVSMNVEHQIVHGSIGKILPSLEYVLVDPDTGAKVEIGKMGRLLVKGPSVFAGYINYEGKSPFIEYQNSLWYNTGDLVIENQDHILTFAGRLKRFIKIGGEMVSLPAIEDALKPHIGDPNADVPQIAVEATDDESNPEIVLFTLVDVDRPITNQYIREAGLSPLHNIRQIRKLNEIPLLGTGKTDYRALKRSLKCDKS